MHNAQRILGEESGLSDVWRTEENVEIKQNIDKNKKEVIQNTGYRLPVLLYGSECWCLRREDGSKLLVAEMSWLKGILGKSRRDRIRNEIIREKMEQKETIIDTIRKRGLTWFGHVTRMENGRLPIMALDSQVDGRRDR